VGARYATYPQIFNFVRSAKKGTVDAACVEPQTFFTENRAPENLTCTINSYVHLVFSELSMVVKLCR
jgi:hypothetical protein